MTEIASRAASPATLWADVIRYARRQVRRASARAHSEQRDLAKAVLRAARERPDGDERRLYLRTWGALRKKRGSPAVESARAGNAAEGELVHFRIRASRGAGRYRARLRGGHRHRGVVAEHRAGVRFLATSEPLTF